MEMVNKKKKRTLIDYVVLRDRRDRDRLLDVNVAAQALPDHYLVVEGVKMEYEFVK